MKIQIGTFLSLAFISVLAQAGRLAQVDDRAQVKQPAQNATTAPESAKERFERERADLFKQEAAGTASLYSCGHDGAGFMILPNNMVIGFLGDDYFSFRGTETVRNGSSTIESSDKKYSVTFEREAGQIYIDFYGHVKTPTRSTDTLCKPNPKLKAKQ